MITCAQPHEVKKSRCSTRRTDFPITVSPTENERNNMTVPRRPFFATNHSATLLLCRLLLLFISSAALVRTTTAGSAFVPATTSRASRPSRRHHLRPDPPSSATAAARGGVGDATTETAASASIADIGEITDFASKNGIELRFTTRGPGYRCVAASKADPENVLGYVEGFIRPTGGILHADKMEIFKKGGGGTFLGPGLLVAFVCFLHGKDCGCKTAEFLAIDDAEYQHKRLIRYYRMMGFREVRYVGEEIRDIPDRLVWGGVGTLMTEDIDAVLTKWTRIIRSSSARMED